MTDPAKPGRPGQTKDKPVSLLFILLLLQLACRLQEWKRERTGWLAKAKAKARLRLQCPDSIDHIILIIISVCCLSGGISVCMFCTIIYKQRDTIQIISTLIDQEDKKDDNLPLLYYIIF